MPWTVLSVWMQSNTCTLMVGVVFKQVILIHGLFESCTYLPFFLPAQSVTGSSVFNAQLIISLLSSILFGSLGCGTLPSDANSVRIAVSP